MQAFQRQRILIPFGTHKLLIDFYNEKLTFQIFNQEQEDTYIWRLQLEQVPIHMRFAFKNIQKIYSYVAENQNVISFENQELLKIHVDVLQKTKFMDLRLEKQILTPEELKKRKIIILGFENQKEKIQLRNYKHNKNQVLKVAKQALKIQTQLKNETLWKKNELEKELASKEQEKIELEMILKKKEELLLNLKDKEGNIINIDE